MDRLDANLNHQQFAVDVWAESSPSNVVPSGRQVADYSGGLDFLDEILQKVLHGLH